MKLSTGEPLEPGPLRQRQCGVLPATPARKFKGLSGCNRNHANLGRIPVLTSESNKVLLGWADRKHRAVLPLGKQGRRGLSRRKAFTDNQLLGGVNRLG